MKEKHKNKRIITKIDKKDQTNNHKMEQKISQKEEQKNKQMLHKKAIEKTGRAVSTFKSEVRNKTGAAITTAFALVIALAWQDVIKETVNRIIENLQLSATELVKMTLLYKSITAIAITLVCVLGIILATRWSNK